MGKHAFNTVLTRLFVTVLMVVQSSLWTRLLAPEGRGLYAKLQASQNFLVLFLGFGVTSGIVYFSSSGRASREQLWSLSFVTSIVGTLITCVMIAIGLIWPASDLIFPKGFEGSFFIIYFVLLFLQSQLQLTMNSFLAAEHQFSNLNRIEVFSTLFRLIIVVIAFTGFREHSTFEFLFCLDLLAHSLKTAAYFRYFKHLNLHTRLQSVTWSIARPVIGYSFALYSLYVIQFLYQRVDFWIIEKWSGLASLGIFSCAVGLAQYLTILPIALNTVLAPHMSRSSSSQAYTDLARFSRLNITLLLFPVLVFTVFPSQVIAIIFGSAFTAGTHSLRVLAWAYWFLAAKHIFVYYNASQDRLKVNFVIEMVGLVIGLTLNFLWVPKWGIDGASYAFLVTGVLTGALSFVSVQRGQAARQVNFFVLTPDDIRSFRQSFSVA
jgi:O-antigen/teichoic acid export membrane protein